MQNWTWNKFAHKFDKCRQQLRQKFLCVDLVALVGRWEQCLKARNLFSRRDLSPLSLFGFPREPPPPPPSGMSLSPSPSVLFLHHLLLLHLHRWPPPLLYSILPTRDHIIFSLSIVLLQPHSILLSLFLSLIFPLFLPFQFSPTLDLLLKFNGVHRGTYYIYRFMIRNAWTCEVRWRV